MTATPETRQPVQKRSRAELQRDADRARAELAATLDAIEDRLNLPKQARLATQRTGRQLRRLASENPLALGAIAVAVATSVGTAVFAVVRAVQK